MTGLLICATQIGAVGCAALMDAEAWLNSIGRRNVALGLALISAALYLAWRAGGTGA